MVANSERNPAQIVTLEIGPHKVKCIVHKEFACHYSPVLNAAFNSEFLEGQTQAYTLEEPDEATTRLLIHWLYTQNLDIELELETFDEDLILAQLWVLAGKLLIPQLQSQILHQIHQDTLKYQRVPTKTLEYVYKETSEDSPLRKFMVPSCACYLKPMDYRNSRDEFPREMLLDIAELYASYANTRGHGELERTFGLGLGIDWDNYEVSEK